MMDDIVLTVLIFAFAVLYSSVGHAGATGYQAAMAFMGLDPAVMKISALVLNIPVAIIGTVRFGRAGSLRWRLLWPFAVASVPAAYVGGMVMLPNLLFKQAIGLMLFLAAGKLILQPDEETSITTATPPLSLSLPVGAAIGLLAGLTGTGGGVLLTPILLFMRWATMRDAAGVSVAFILLNSVSGLAGQSASVSLLPAPIWFWIAAGVAGGLVGTQLSLRHLAVSTIRRMLGVVLIIAGMKMLLNLEKIKVSPPDVISSTDFVANFTQEAA